MSAGIRDERCGVYSYSDVGNNGRALPTYALSGTYWSRRSVPSGREATIAGQAGMKVDAVFAFDSRLTIPPDGALKYRDGTVYKITSILPVREVGPLAEQIVYAAYSDEQVLAGTV